MIVRLTDGERSILDTEISPGQFVWLVNRHAERLGGWRAWLEQMTGVIFFTHPTFAPGIRVYATPEWESEEGVGEIVCQIDDNRGHVLAAEAIPWPLDEDRTTARYLALVIPLLAMIGMAHPPPPPTYLVVKFDVSRMTGAEIDALTGEVTVQAEENDDHPSCTVVSTKIVGP